MRISSVLQASLPVAGPEFLEDGIRMSEAARRRACHNSRARHPRRVEIPRLASLGGIEGVDPVSQRVGRRSAGQSRDGLLDVFASAL